MRKLLVMAFLVFSGTGAFAQLQQGNRALSGSVMLGRDESTQNVNNQEIKTINHLVLVNPAIGLFLKDNLEAGVGVSLAFTPGSGYSYNGDNPLLPHKSTGYGLAFTPYLKRYWKLTDQLYLTGMAAVTASYHLTKVRVPDSPALNTTGRGYYVGASLSPGLNYFISDHFSLATSLGLLGYSHSYTKTKGENLYSATTDNQFSFSLIPKTYTFGIGYYFNR
ncbi:DUF3575 domain-containing protein [Pontibacter liquoris]|uniref:DUF3575 domain-containing protein n=1 Tax=Pontibacter liquoris TaxID=2905677 RepID=UPI001FA6DFD3|nr:DUF3575 domain-containing protein [Pontibacter liquoris]